MNSSAKIQSIGASSEQKGRAAELRYALPYAPSELHSIVHSGDVNGRYRNWDNKFRDLTNSFDPKAEEVLKKYEKEKQKQPPLVMSVKGYKKKI